MVSLYRWGILAMVAAFGLAMGFILFVMMVSIFVPKAMTFLFPFFVPLIGVPLVVGGILLIILYEIRVRFDES